MAQQTKSKSRKVGKSVKQAHIGKRPHGREVALWREPLADRKNTQAQGEFVGSEGRRRRG